MNEMELLKKRFKYVNELCNKAINERNIEAFNFLCAEERSIMKQISELYDKRLENGVSGK